MKKLHRNIFFGLIACLEKVFFQKTRASQALLKIINSNPKWGKRDRSTITDCFYSCIRWKSKYEYFIGEKFVVINQDDLIKLIGVWLTLNDFNISNYIEYEGFDSKKILNNSKKIINDPVISFSIPDWMDQIGNTELPNTWIKEIESLNRPGKVSIRVNRIQISRNKLQNLLSNYSIETKIDSKYPDALILLTKKNILKNPLYLKGFFEIQDANSQLIAPYTLVEPNMTVIDACSGAGGKALHLASLMRNKGEIIAMDIKPNKLKELSKRAIRNKVNIIKPLLINETDTLEEYFSSADRILIDSPCSGVGTLKRNPELKWRLSKDFINNIMESQIKLLEKFSRLLKPNGKIVYATCSIFPCENEKQISKFLKSDTGSSFILEEEIAYSTINSDFNGFYSARLMRK